MAISFFYSWDWIYSVWGWLFYILPVIAFIFLIIGCLYLKKDERNLIQNKKPVLVNNLKDLEKVEKRDIMIIGKVGKKKRIEIVKKAKEKGILIYNFNIKKFLNDLEKEKKVKEENKEKGKKESKEKKK